MGLAAVACVEENFEPESGRIDTTPGNEIVFTASAGGVVVVEMYGTKELKAVKIDKNYGQI